MASTKQAFRSFMVAVLNLVVALVLLEGLLLTLLHARGVTAAAPRTVRAVAQQVYRHFNRALIQFDPACAQYDPDVTYTLKPGRCTFGNLEFTNQYRINRLGLRDDDAALEGPDVIVLGDSHAMGWGVEQDEAFPRVAGARAGLKVLNAGVSSYGTVREVKLLDRLDTSRLRILVVQYSDNDVIENHAFQTHDNALPITTRARYDEIERYYTSQSSYFPGKYVYRLIMKLTRLERAEPENLAAPSISAAEEARLFLNALGHAGRTSLERVQLVVLDIDQDFSRARSFIAALDDAVRAPESSGPAKETITLDATLVLKPDDFYVLDDHMTARGHARVGEALGNLLTRLSRTDWRTPQSSANSSRQP